MKKFVKVKESKALPNSIYSNTYYQYFGKILDDDFKSGVGFFIKNNDGNYMAYDLDFFE